MNYVDIHIHVIPCSNNCILEENSQYAAGKYFRIRKLVTNGANAEGMNGLHLSTYTTIILEIIHLAILLCTVVYMYVYRAL